jgi:hypothetical protein
MRWPVVLVERPEDTHGRTILVASATSDLDGGPRYVFGQSGTRYRLVGLGRAILASEEEEGGGE